MACDEHVAQSLQGILLTGLLTAELDSKSLLKRLDFENFDGLQIRKLYLDSMAPLIRSEVAVVLMGIYRSDVESSRRDEGESNVGDRRGCLVSEDGDDSIAGTRQSRKAIPFCHDGLPPAAQREEAFVHSGLLPQLLEPFDMSSVPIDICCA
jgi:hypothetical protein